MASQNDETSEEAMVQVPAGILTSLLATVEQLKAEISTVRQDTIDLRATNASLHRQIQHLERSSSIPRFSKFPDLPPEIRCAIWKMALSVPQVHIFDKNMSSRSRVNVVMQACREARDQGLKLKLPYFQVCHTLFDCDDGLSPVKHYMNWEQDIIWQPDLDEYKEEDCISLCCTSCKPYSTEWPSARPAYYHDICGCLGTGEIRLEGLAMAFDGWEFPTSDGNGGWKAGSMTILWNYRNVRNLYLVVNDIRSKSDRNVVFVEPGYPQKVSQETFRSYIGWSAYSRTIERDLKDYKAKQAEMRTRAVTKGWTESDEDNLELIDLSSWIVPSVHFVEAISTDLQRNWQTSINATSI